MLGNQIQPLGVTNSALSGILVKAPKDIIQLRPEV